MNTIIPILIFLLILGVVVFIHEFGHFIAARRAGIFVEEFAIGMGPKLFGQKGKKKSHDGETTLYSLRAFPIGGFCRMRGMDGEAGDDPEAMNNKPIGARFLVIVGGSIMNFLLAFVLFFIVAMLRGYLVAEVTELINDDMPAAQAGIRAGDLITHINGDRLDFQSESLSAIAQRNQPIELRVNRAGERHDFTVQPIFDAEIGRYLIGVRNDYYRWNEEIGVGSGIVFAAELIAFNIGAPFKLISQFIAGEQLPEGAGVIGPIGLGSVVTEVYQETVEDDAIGIGDLVITLIMFTALINAALGIMNLMPIPLLDGSRLIFLLIEAVRKKPVPPEKEAIVHMVGFALIIILAIFIAYQDIARIIESSGISG